MTCKKEAKIKTNGAKTAVEAILACNSSLVKLIHPKYLNKKYKPKTINPITKKEIIILIMIFFILILLSINKKD